MFTLFDEGKESTYSQYFSTIGNESQMVPGILKYNGEGRKEAREGKKNLNNLNPRPMSPIQWPNTGCRCAFWEWVRNSDRMELPLMHFGRWQVWLVNGKVYGKRKRLKLEFLPTNSYEAWIEAKILPLARRILLTDWSIWS